MSNLYTSSAARSVCATVPGIIKGGIGGTYNCSLALAV